MSNATVTLLPRFQRATAKPLVVALHCSGASGAEWRQLGQDLDPRLALVAPDLIGSGGNAHWSGAHAFALTDEAAAVVEIIDRANAPVHLIGHSYGACVAMRAAYERPTKVASMVLYEPVAWPYLTIAGEDGALELAKINRVFSEIKRHLLTGAQRTAAKRFYEFWNGARTWSSMRPEAQAELIRYIPKLPLEFAATLTERVPLHAYRRFNVPVLLLQGEHAPAVTRLIAAQLAKAMRFASLQTVYGAGHLGPLTHPAAVSAIMTEWIARMEPTLAGAEPATPLNITRVA
jgi:pimeloyl-ACP methyl ester carboxylesterase